MDKNRSLDLDNEENSNDPQEKLHFYLSSIKGKNIKKLSKSQMLLYSIVIFFVTSISVLFVLGINLIILIVCSTISIAIFYFDKKIREKDASEY